MNATRTGHRRQFGAGRRILLAQLAAAALAVVLLSALYLSVPRSASKSLDQMPPTSAIAAPPAYDPGSAPPHVFRSGGATFHEDVDMKNLPAEPDPSARAVAAYGQ